MKLFSNPFHFGVFVIGGILLSGSYLWIKEFDSQSIKSIPAYLDSAEKITQITHHLERQNTVVATMTQLHSELAMDLIFGQRDVAEVFRNFCQLAEEEGILFNQLKTHFPDLDDQEVIVRQIVNHVEDCLNRISSKEIQKKKRQIEKKLRKYVKNHHWSLSKSKFVS